MRPSKHRLTWLSATQSLMPELLSLNEVVLMKSSIELLWDVKPSGERLGDFSLSYDFLMRKEETKWSLLFYKYYEMRARVTASLNSFIKHFKWE